MGEEFHSPLRVVTDASVLERTGIKKTPELSHEFTHFISSWALSSHFANGTKAPHLNISKS